MYTSKHQKIFQLQKVRAIREFHLKCPWQTVL